METVERLLREEFTDPESTVALDRTVMLARVRRSQRRHTVAQVAAAMAVLVVVGGATAAARPWTGHGFDPAEPPQNTAPTSFTVVHGVGFADRDHGYVLVSECVEMSQGSPPGPDTEAIPGTTECRLRLAATSVGGSRWSDVTIPAQLLSSDQGHVLTVIGPGTVAVHSAEHGRRWLTRDGGRTWQEDPAEPTATVPSVPSDALLAVAPGKPPTEPPTEPPTLQVVAADGTVSRLAPGPTEAQPTMVDTTVHQPAVRASDGTRWVPCATAAKQGCVLTTADGGTRWRPLYPAPLPAGESWTSWVSTLDGRTVCVGIHGGAADGVSAVQPIFRSVDAGTTWEQLVLPTLSPSTENRLVHGIGGAEVMANGDIILAADGTLYRQAVGAKTFESIPHAPADVVGLGRSGPWLVATSFGGSTSRASGKPALVHLSMDGITWTDVWLP